MCIQDFRLHFKIHPFSVPDVWCEVVSSELCSFNNGRCAPGLQAFKRDFPRAELQWATQFRPCVSWACLHWHLPSAGTTSGPSAFALLLTWMRLLSRPSLPLLCFCSSYSWCKRLVWALCSGSWATVWTSSSNIGRYCFPSPQSEKPRPWPRILWAGLATAAACATLVTAVSPKPSQRRGHSQTLRTLLISSEGNDWIMC